MTTGTPDTKIKSLETHNTHKHTHTGKLDVHKRETVCKMPDTQGCRREGERRSRSRDKDEVGGVGDRWRMKADAEQHQLRTTAAGEPDMAQRGRKKRESMLKSHWRNGGAGEKKLNEALVRLADRELGGGCVCV